MKAAGYEPVVVGSEEGTSLQLVEDGNLITSRKPDDLPAFSDAIVRQLEGRIPQRPRPSAPDPRPQVR